MVGKSQELIAKKVKKGSNELAFLQQFGSTARKSDHIIYLLDSFETASGQWIIIPKFDTLQYCMIFHPSIGQAGVRICWDLIDGLAYLHGLFVAHGDIKPENVIVQDDLVAALCDFGISKIHVEQHTGLTTSGVTGGTSGYQAKELLNEDPATPATDVYAFGGLILAVRHVRTFRDVFF